MKLDEAEAREDGLHIEGVLEVNLLYLTDDDTEPVGATTEMVPVSYTPLDVYKRQMKYTSAPG